MSRTLSLARIASMSLAVVALVSLAQEDGRIRASSFRDLSICQSEGDASRVRATCDPESVAPTRSERELRLPVETPVLPVECQATVATDYLQHDTLVNVAGTIEVTSCAAAGGELTISARVVDGNGESTTLEFTEAWQRGGGEDPVAFEASYPIGENAELLSLRVRAVRCTCLEQAD